MEGECVICKGPFSLLYGGKELYDSLTCNHLLMANFSLYFYASVAPILMLALTLIKRSYNKHGNRASNRGSPKFQNHEEWPYYVLIDSMLRIYANQTACHLWPLYIQPSRGLLRNSKTSRSFVWSSNNHPASPCSMLYQAQAGISHTRSHSVPGLISR